MPAERDATIEARLSTIDLANIARYLVRTNFPILTKSDLVFRGLQIAAHAIQASRPEEEPIRSTQEALSYLESIGLSGTNRGGRGKQILLNNLRKEALSADGFPSTSTIYREAKPALSPEDLSAEAILGLIKQGLIATPEEQE